MSSGPDLVLAGGGKQTVRGDSIRRGVPQAVPTAQAVTETAQVASILYKDTAQQCALVPLMLWVHKRTISRWSIESPKLDASFMYAYDGREPFARINQQYL